MDEVENLCSTLQEKLKGLPKKQLIGDTTDGDPPPKTEVSSEENEQTSKANERFFIY